MEKGKRRGNEAVQPSFCPGTLSADVPIRIIFVHDLYSYLYSIIWIVIYLHNYNCMFNDEIIFYYVLIHIFS